MRRFGVSLVTPTRATQVATWAIGAVVALTAAYLLARYPSLPDLLPVRFRRGGLPIGWQYKTLGRVLTPVFVQAALASTFGTVAALLLSRNGSPDDSEASDVRAARVAAEAVVLIALVWILFQAYAALALERMWTIERGGLGRPYTYLEGAGLVATVAVAVRARARLGRPGPRPFVADHWRFGQLYKNADDPALFVPTRDGSRWTLNFGRPVVAVLLGVVLLVGVVGPTLILVLALRS